MSDKNIQKLIESNLKDTFNKNIIDIIGNYLNIDKSTLSINIKASYINNRGDNRRLNFDIKKSK